MLTVFTCAMCALGCSGSTQPDVAFIEDVRADIPAFEQLGNADLLAEGREICEQGIRSGSEAERLAQMFEIDVADYEELIRISEERLCNAEWQHIDRARNNK